MSGADHVGQRLWPLYLFAGDAEAGDAAGQGLQDVWWVVNAAGEPVRE